MACSKLFCFMPHSSMYFCFIKLFRRNKVTFFGFKITVITEYFELEGTHNDHWWSWIKLWCLLRVPHNLKYSCAFLMPSWAAFDFISTCHAVISETPCKYNWSADRGPVLSDRDQAPSYLPFHIPQEKNCSFLTLWSWAMPTSCSQLSPRGE